MVGSSVTTVISNGANRSRTHATVASQTPWLHANGASVAVAGAPRTPRIDERSWVASSSPAVAVHPATQRFRYTVLVPPAARVRGGSIST